MRVKAKFKNKTGNSFEVDLELYTFIQDGIRIIYAPALDLSGYGKTAEDSKKSFEETMTEFLNYTISNGTLTGELKRLGWHIQKHLSTPPTTEELISSNSQLKEIIIGTGTYKKHTERISIPTC